MANNVFNWQSKRSTGKSVGIHSIDTLSSLSAQMKLLNKKMDNLNMAPHHTQDTSYDLSGGDQDIKVHGKLSKGQNNFQKLAQNQF